MRVLLPLQYPSTLHALHRRIQPRLSPREREHGRGHGPREHFAAFRGLGPRQDYLKFAAGSDVDVALGLGLAQSAASYLAMGGLYGI